MTEQEYAVRADALKGKLYGMAFLYLGSQSLAVDAVDEAVYLGLRACRKLREEAHFNTWLTRILYTVSGGDYDSYHVYPSITGPDGEELEGYSIISGEAAPGELSDFNVNYSDDSQVPEALRLTCKVTAQREAGDGTAPAADESIWDEPAPAPAAAAVWWPAAPTAPTRSFTTTWRAASSGTRSASPCTSPGRSGWTRTRSGSRWT